MISMNSQQKISTAFNTEISNVKSLSDVSPSLLPDKQLSHHLKAGLNPVVDAAASLFSLLGRIKELKSYCHLNILQKDLINEMTLFQETIKSHGYNTEYLIVCRYILCATFDDIISDTPWGAEGNWQSHSLLANFNQDIHHQTKFFSILERAVNEPTLYIDLMELIYICLSLGYKGQFRHTEFNQYQLEQITNHLYKHIRNFRGSFSKQLSPPLRAMPVSINRNKDTFSFMTIMFITTCLVMGIFICLGYLMDAISNDSHTLFSPVKAPIFREISQ